MDTGTEVRPSCPASWHTDHRVSDVYNLRFMEKWLLLRCTMTLVEDPAAISKSKAIMLDSLMQFNPREGYPASSRRCVDELVTCRCLVYHTYHTA